MDVREEICIECGELITGKPSLRRADGPVHEVCPKDRGVTREGLDWIPPDLTEPSDSAEHPPGDEEEEAKKGEEE